jgi:hypothetical protein
MAGADAWFVNGQCTQHLGGGRIRVASRHAGGRSTQLQLAESTARPVAFAVPLPATMHASCTFDPAVPASIIEAIGVFEFVLAPQAAKFLLAAQIVQQQEVLGSGAFEVRAKGHLIAVVDMRGEAGVLPSVRPSNFEAAVWKRVDRERLVTPPNFARASLSELMWNYVSRSSRELLPDRYRNCTIYFRRPPRVDPLLLGEDHLLVVRELTIRPCRFDELLQRIDAPEEAISRAVAALYYAGAITSTRARAAPTSLEGDLRVQDSSSNYGALAERHVELADLRHLTVPAPLAFA